MCSSTRLEDFGVLDGPEDRVREHQQKCRRLPSKDQAAYWRGVFKDDPELFKFMNGREYKEAIRRQRVIRRRS